MYNNGKAIQISKRLVFFRDAKTRQLSYNNKLDLSKLPSFFSGKWKQLRYSVYDLIFKLVFHSKSPSKWFLHHFVSNLIPFSSILPTCLCKSGSGSQDLVEISTLLFCIRNKTNKNLSSLNKTNKLKLKQNKCHQFVLGTYITWDPTWTL